MCGHCALIATSSEQVDRLLRTVVSVALANREELDRLDAAAADGDFGSTLARGAAALAASPPEGDAAERLRGASEVVVDAMGGSSGPLCGVALLRASEALGAGDDAIDGPKAGELVRAAIAGIQDFGGAERGDKTALDALFPLAEALEGDGGDAAEVARRAADDTAEVQARKGRAAYAGERSTGSPDPGAVAVALVVEALAGDSPDWAGLARGNPNEERGADGSSAREGFVADPDSFVGDALDGFVRAHPDLVLRLEGTQVIVRADRDTGSGRVAVVSGGGAGHEPLHAGFVGEGMLDAAVPGAVFTSPSPGEVFRATEAVAAGGGVLHVVKSYTGDILNFRMAAEFAAAEDIETATVVVADDVAIAADSDTDRRGTGVTLAVEKVAGARATEGAGLGEVAEVARRVAERGRSFGVALHGTEMELGVGIHGEPGRDPVPIDGADTLAAALLEPILAELEVDADTPLLVLLSGLGGTPSLELHVLFEHVGRELDRRGLHVARSLVGDLITSLGQPGAVLSVVALDAELLRLWDAPVHTAALRR